MGCVIDGIDVSMAVPAETVAANIKRNSARGLDEIVDGGDWRYEMNIAIVGGGPSLAGELETLRKFRNIMACGSVHDYLIENRVKPRWVVVVDPDPIMARYLSKAPMAPRSCSYLVASQCDSQVFTALRYNYVQIWHAGDSTKSTDIFGPGKYLIGGGCTVGTRAIVIARAFGFKNIHLFGFDTCVSDRHHAYDFVDQSETIGTVQPIRIGGENGREFMMADYHIGQLFDFKELLRLHGHEMSFQVHGDGVIAELMRLGREGRLDRAA